MVYGVHDNRTIKIITKKVLSIEKPVRRIATLSSTVIRRTNELSRKAKKEHQTSSRDQMELFL